MIPQVYSPQSYSPMNAGPYISQPQISHSSIPPSQQYQSYMNHETSSVPQSAYHSPPVSTQPMIEFPQLDLVLAVPVFTQGDDPIAYLNKAMPFLSVVAASRQGQSYAGTGYKGNATSSGGKIMQEGRQGLLNVIIFKVKDIWLGNALSLREQGMLHGLRKGNTEDLDAYDSDFDDVSNAKAVLMANLSNYGLDIISEVPHFELYHNDMDNKSVHAMQGFEQTPVVDFTDNKITSDNNIITYSQSLQETQHAAIQDTNLYAQQDSMILSVIEQMLEQMINHVNNWEKANQEKNNEFLTAELERYKERVKTFEQRLNIDLSTCEKMIDSQMDDMFKEKIELKKQIDSLEQNLSNQIKENESLFQTFTVFRNKSKEKESKYVDKEIDLEKKIKEQDNIVYKVGQSAQTVHMLTKPQVFYDDTHKQALGYQNLFYLKKAQRI
ncbi:hypothetical protein Tco_1286802, partial [Tanacetum coccineum]